MSIEEGEETQTKSIDNLFNKMITENFPNLEKDRVIQAHNTKLSGEKKKHP
jgi:hypothetical protein